MPFKQRHELGGVSHPGAPESCRENKAKNILTEKPARKTAWLQRDERGRDEVREGWTGDIHRKSLGRALGFMPVR